jgi:DNA repair protein RadC
MIVSREKAQVSTPMEAADLLKKILNKEDQISRDREHFWVITVNSRKKVRFVELISLGTMDSTVVHPREIFRRAIKRGAASVILGHNHPSGDTQPSTEDLEMTKRIVEAGKIIGIEVLDHVVIGINGFSFKEKGLI